MSGKKVAQTTAGAVQTVHLSRFFAAILLTLMPMTMPAVQETEMKGYATLHLRILSTAGLIVRPVVVVLQNQEAGLRIELSQSEDSAREGLGAGKTPEPLEELILRSVPYGKYKVSVRSSLMRQVESNLEIHVEASVFSRSIFMAEDRPMRQWDSSSGPPPMLKVESRSVPEAFAWVQLRYLHRFTYLVEGRLDESGSMPLPQLSEGEYVAIIFSRRGSPWSTVIRYQGQSPAVLQVVRKSQAQWHWAVGAGRALLSWIFCAV
jgi:hypothetical protein